MEPHDIEKPSLKGEEAVDLLGAEQQMDATASIQNAFDVIKRNLEQHYEVSLFDDLIDSTHLSNF